jgi:aryl-alcohol dehydrogenase-like predicted oxidoreductase
MNKRGNRDQMVIATKYTAPYRATFGDKEIIINTGGNGTKSMRNSVESSLKNLQTSYIDLVIPLVLSQLTSFT